MPRNPATHLTSSDDDGGEAETERRGTLAFIRRYTMTTQGRSRIKTVLNVYSRYILVVVLFFVYGTMMQLLRGSDQSSADESWAVRDVLVTDLENMKPVMNFDDINQMLSKLQYRCITANGNTLSAKMYFGCMISVDEIEPSNVMMQHFAKDGAVSQNGTWFKKNGIETNGWNPPTWTRRLENWYYDTDSRQGKYRRTGIRCDKDFITEHVMIGDNPLRYRYGVSPVEVWDVNPILDQAYKLGELKDFKELFTLTRAEAEAKGVLKYGDEPLGVANQTSGGKSKNLGKKGLKGKGGKRAATSKAKRKPAAKQAVLGPDDEEDEQDEEDGSALVSVGAFGGTDALPEVQQPTIQEATKEVKAATKEVQSDEMGIVRRIQPSSPGQVSGADKKTDAEPTGSKISSTDLGKEGKKAGCGTKTDDVMDQVSYAKNCATDFGLAQLPPMCFTMTDASVGAVRDWKRNGSKPGEMPRDEWMVAPRCRNHHWGLLGHCNPDSITVQIRIRIRTLLYDEKGVDFVEGQKPKGTGRTRVELDTGKNVTVNYGIEETPLKTVGLKLQFKRIRTQLHDVNLFLYQARVTMNTMVYPRALPHRIIALNYIFIILFVAIFRSEITAVFRWPYSLTRFLSRCWAVEDPDEAVDLVNEVWDPLDIHNKYTGFEDLMLGFLVVCVTLLKAIMSVNYFFTVQMMKNSASVNPTNIDVMECESNTMKTLYEYMKLCVVDLPMYDRVGLSILLNMHINGNENGLFLLLSLLLMSIGSMAFAKIPLTRWIDFAIRKIALPKLVTFTPVFFFLLLGFGILFHIQFAGIFIQFNSIYDSTMALLTNALDQNVLLSGQDNVQPLYDTNAQKLFWMTAMYYVVLVIVCLNVMLSIVLDGVGEGLKHANDHHDEYAQKLEFVQGSMFFPNLDRETDGTYAGKPVSPATSKSEATTLPELEQQLAGQVAALSKTHAEIARLRGQG